ncbi:MAG: hypothetical protein KC589_01405 [Nanoarchaeota archaeon]|nr:hypothetical protein [Nanoarchaeota archaeon]
MNNIKKLYDDIYSKLDSFYIMYEGLEKEILYRLSKIQKDKNPSLFEAYFSFLKRNNANYAHYAKNESIKKGVNLILYKIINSFEDYERKYYEFKDYVQTRNLENYQINTVRRLLIKIDAKNREISKIVMTNYNLEYNDYYQSLQDLKNLINQVKYYISIVEHKVFNAEHFSREIDYSKLSKLDFLDLKMGDIILYEEDPKKSNSFVTKQISLFIKTKITHSAVFYKKENDKFIIFQARGADRKKSYLAPFKVRPDYKYLVLRLRHTLNVEQKKQLEINILENINKKFSLIKIYGAGFNIILENLYKKWFWFLEEGRNPVKTSNIYCSEVIGKIYGGLGYNISNKIDISSLSPVDIFNSPELKIVGYIEERKK